MSKTSGSAQTFELEWDGSQYKTVLTDENNVVGNFSFSASESGVNCTVEGNQLIITAAEAPSESFTITAYKEAARRGVITWTDGNMGSGIQDVVAYAQTVSDPIQGFVNLKVSYGSAKIIKTSEDGIVEGISFQITGNGVDETVQTGPNGEIQIDNLKPGEYTVTELSEDRYVPQDSQSVTVQAGQVATVEFSNILKKFTIELTKSDSEKGEAQGDATLEGAKYGLYKGEELIDTYTTDETGSFTTKEYICGPDWTIREIEPSHGYLLDETIHEVGADAGNFEIEHNTIPVGVGEDVIKGDIAIIKHTDDGSTQIEPRRKGLLSKFISNPQAALTPPPRKNGILWSAMPMALRRAKNFHLVNISLNRSKAGKALSSCRPLLSSSTNTEKLINTLSTMRNLKLI